VTDGHTKGAYDSNITGFKAFYLTTLLLAMVWVGIHPVLVPTFVLAQTGSATDVDLVPVLMALFCGLALVVGLRGRRIRDQYLAEVAREKEAEAKTRVLGSH